MTNVTKYGILSADRYFTRISGSNLGVLMHRLIDRFILILLITIAAFLGDSYARIYIILAAVIFACLGYRFYENKGHTVIVAAEAACMIVWDMLFPICMLIVYESLFSLMEQKRKEWPWVVVAIALMLIKYLAGAEFFWTSWMGVVSFAGCFIAGFLAFQSSSVEKYRNRAISLADDSEETRKKLADKNLYLIQKQDDEITMATLKERNRIAREIHDNVGHLLSRSIIQVGALMTVNKDESTKAMLAGISDTLNESMTSIRNSVHNLHNDSVDLKRSICELIERNDNVKTSFDYDINSEVPIKIKYCFISIITEAYENFRKHSDGDAVVLSLVEHPAFYRLVFSDNGSGGSVKESGIGLHNMQARVLEAGGILTINSEHGFRIFVSIPKGDKHESSDSR